MKTYISILLIISIISFGHTQISIDSYPKSMNLKLENTINEYETQSFDYNLIKAQDQEDIENGKPYKFGHNISVDINFFEKANLTILKNGDKVYRLKIISQDALSLNFIFNNFQLSKNSELFLYDEEYSNIIGAFTHLNNKPNRRFSTTPIFSDTIIIEFYEPFNIPNDSKINISNIIHGYKNLNNNRGYDDSQSCHNNVNCAAAQPWIDEKNSVVMTITDGGTRLCSGTMINNVNQDYEPYFLTSQNCLGGHEDWIFMFNYESPTCQNQDGIISNTTSGSILIENNSFSDFALLKLSEIPPASYNAYYAGWDAREIVPSNCVVIHHPVGDVKKISFHNGNAISDGWFFNDNSHWRITDWYSGITEPGSYGAPLFNENFHIVGQLHGGESDCENSINDYFGKFSKSWTLGLNQWLDPNNTGIQVLDGSSENDLPDPNLTYEISNDYILVMDQEIENSYFNIYNDGEQESTLSYSMYNSPFSSLGSYPDLGSYHWIDSKNNSDYDFYWIDISDIGSIVEFDDNDIASNPFLINFDFPFYNDQYNSLIINPNGWVGFLNDNNEWDNISIPSENAPLASIMAFWDDLNPINSENSLGMSGNVMYYSDDSKCVIWYDNVVHWGENNPYNFQIVLYKSGLIDINYRNMEGELSSATIGIQNQFGQIGHQVAFNTNYVQNNLRLSFKQSPNWFSIDTQDIIENSLDYNSNYVHNLQVDGYLMDDGLYEAYIHLESNATGPIIIPISVQVGYQSLVGDVNIDGQINVQDVVLLINILIGNANPNNEADINQDNEINILDAVILVGLILNS